MTGTRQELEILHQCGKSLQLKVRKFYGITHTFPEVTEEKLVGGLFPRFPSPTAS